MPSYLIQARSFKPIKRTVKEDKIIEAVEKLRQSEKEGEIVSAQKQEGTLIWEFWLKGTQVEKVVETNDIAKVVSDLSDDYEIELIKIIDTPPPFEARFNEPAQKRGKIFPDSSVIKRISWSDDRVLDVTLNSDRTYRYRDVPEEVFKNFADTESAGRYYNKIIKGTYERFEVL